MRIAVVTHGGGIHGLGHVVRSFAFADVARQRGHEVRIYVSMPDHLRDWGVAEQASVTSVDGIEQGVRLAATWAPDVIALDTKHCAVDELQRFEHRRPLLVSLSPVFNAMEQVDVLFSRSAVADGVTQGRVFAGLEYCILGEHVQHIPDELYAWSIAAPKLQVAVCFGGTDPTNLTGQFVEALLATDEPLAVWAVPASEASTAIAEMRRRRAGTSHDLIIVDAAFGMWDVLRMCSAGVFGGGLTSFESVRAGLPAFHFVREPSDLALLAPLVERDVTLHAEVIGPHSALHAAQLVGNIARNRSTLGEVRTRCRATSLHDGAENCVVALEAIFAEMPEGWRAG